MCRGAADERPRPVLLTAALGALANLAACGSPPAGLDTGRAPPTDAPAADASAAPDARAGMPDITVNVARARVDLAVRTAEFADDACELDPAEACIGAPGTRRLLHFGVETPNIGDGDLVLGEPDPGNPLFQFSECHHHYHFLGYAEYRLVDDAGGRVATGRKQAFCLLDTSRYVDDPGVPAAPKYRCNSQGIQRGWSDVYHAALPCQFIDITDVPDGAYTLEIELNADRTVAERDFANNLASIPVDLGAPELATPLEACPDGADAHSTSGTHRECGWEEAGTFSCVPGSRASVGCSSSRACGGGTCTGDPMIRVCDGDQADGCSFAGALDSSDSSASTPCPCALGLTCPASGQLRVYTAPSVLGAAYQCDVQVVN